MCRNRPKISAGADCVKADHLAAKSICRIGKSVCACCLCRKKIVVWAGAVVCGIRIFKHFNIVYAVNIFGIHAKLVCNCDDFAERADIGKRACMCGIFCGSEKRLFVSAHISAAFGKNVKILCVCNCVAALAVFAVKSICHGGVYNLVYI